MEYEEYNISNIEVRSEEVQEILGRAPRWIIRAGISVILAVVVTILIGAWFFKYPDIISSSIILTTENPPASLKAMSSGKITELFCEENEIVNTQTVIAVVENSADYFDVRKLGAILDTSSTYNYELISTNFRLGELQQNYSAYLRLLKNYQNFKELDYYAARIESVEQQKSDYRLYYDRLLIQSDIQEQELKLAGVQYRRDKDLFESGVYAKAEFEKAEKTYLQHKRALESAKTTLANTQMQMNQLDQTILDLKLQETQELTRQENSIQESFENLKSELKSWEQRYLILSPISGKVTFTKVWSENQFVQAGEVVATVIPTEETKIVGKLEIPSVGIGKVRIGQRVNVKFDNFPHMEYGMVIGEVANISLIPTVTDRGTIYTANMSLSDSLVSNYGKQLEFTQEMTGSAEIITDDVRLLERFLNPIKSVFKEKVR